MTSNLMVKYLIVEFDLPYVLRLVDSMRKEAIPEGYEEYIIAKNGVPAKLQFDKRVRAQGGPYQVALEDRRGLLSFSSVRVSFESRFVASYQICDFRRESGLIIRVALEYVNRFLHLYREASGDHWIHEIVRADIPTFRLIELRKDGSQDECTAGNLGLGRGLGVLLTKQQDDDLRGFLGSDHRLDDIQRLADIVLRLMDTSDYWAAAIAAEMLFEAKVARILRLALERLGKSGAEIDVSFQGRNRQPLSIDSLIRKWLPKLTAIPLDNSDHPLWASGYTEWASKARDLRNDIAHGKSVWIGKEQAREAIKAICQFLSEIERLVPGIRPTRLVYEDYDWTDIPEGLVLDGLVGFWTTER